MHACMHACRIVHSALPHVQNVHSRGAFNSTVVYRIKRHKKAPYKHFSQNQKVQTQRKTESCKIGDVFFFLAPQQWKIQNGAGPLQREKLGWTEAPSKNGE